MSDEPIHELVKQIKEYCTEIIKEKNDCTTCTIQETCKRHFLQDPASWEDV